MKKKNHSVLTVGMTVNFSFSQGRLCIWPHFESEEFWNSEVAYCKQLLDAVFVIPRIIKVSVSERP